MPGYDDFEALQLKVKSAVIDDDIVINCKKGGSGPPLLLLHGYPQTMHIWHLIAAQLSEKYTVVATDLRGYGGSSKPKGSDSHVEYSKREMAADQVQVMQSLGFDSFFLVGHDRGARVSHRLALDHPKAVKELMILDIAPTLFMYDETDMKFADGYWHWFFLIQPAPGPERMIMASPEAYWEAKAGTKTHRNVIWSPGTVDIYRKAFENEETVHATCEDYRAAATIDLDHDRSDLASGNKLQVPVHVIWGKHGMIEKYGDVVGVWKGYCKESVEVTGKSLPCGHYIPEEQPEALLAEILSYMV